MAHQGYVVATIVLYRLVEGEGDGARSDVEGAAGHHPVTAVDGDRDNGQAKFQCQLKGAVLEGAHLAGVGAAALGKHDNVWVSTMM